MNIYFAGSITGGRDDASLYQKIIKHLQGHGKVLTEHVGDSSLSDNGQDKTPQEIFDTDVKWLAQADVLVAEVTTPSLGVGYEIALAKEMNKKILCLYRQDNLSKFIIGSGVTCKKYQELDEAKSFIDEFFA